MSGGCLSGYPLFIYAHRSHRDARYVPASLFPSSLAAARALQKRLEEACYAGFSPFDCFQVTDLIVFLHKLYLCES